MKISSETCSLLLDRLGCVRTNKFSQRAKLNIFSGSVLSKAEKGQEKRKSSRVR